MTTTNTTNKVTKAQWIDIISGIVKASKYENKKGALEFLAHEKELLEKKAGKSKEAKANDENAAIKEAILEVLAENARMTISQMLEDDRLMTYEKKTKDKTETKKMSPQKLSALVKQLKDAELVVRVEEKKVAYFSIPKTEEATEEMQVLVTLENDIENEVIENEVEEVTQQALDAVEILLQITKERKEGN